MEKIISFLSKNFVSTLGILVLTGATVTTSAMGMAKVVNTMEKPSLTVPEVQESTQTSSQTQSNSSNSNTNSFSSFSSVSSRPAFTPLNKTQNLSTNTSGTNSSVSTQAQANTGCIVTLFGKQYNVTSLQNTHSGGNFFNCGTDMTSVYQAQHGTNVSRMQQYLVTTSNSTNTTGTNVSSNSSMSSDSSESIKKDDDDDKQEQEIRNEDQNEEEKHVDEDD